MKNLRFAAGLPFVLFGTAFAWIGIVIVRVGYLIGGPYKRFDPLALFDDYDQKSPIK
jgi:hypothetical protein